MEVKMELHSQTDAISVQNDREPSWFNDDDVLDLNSVVTGVEAAEKSHSSRGSVYGRLLVSPLFLGVMVSVIVLVPKKVLKYQKNFITRCYRFSKRVIKRGVDLLGSALGLFVSLLVFFVLAILIKLDSHGSIIFKQRRVGRNRRKQDRRVIDLQVPVERRGASRRQEDLLGKPFTVYKFRSMKQDAEKKTGPIWASENDPRVTNIGRILRPYHIDEIPQLVNVLKGEMSLVGPRPERPEFVAKLKDEVPGYEHRFKSKPGLTGLAQVRCGYDVTTEDVKRKLNFDLEYIGSTNVMNDLRIIWDTVRQVFAGRREETGDRD